MYGVLMYFPLSRESAFPVFRSETAVVPAECVAALTHKTPYFLSFP
jgi:hypothetical protein